ncbi:MAG: hypothetical protein V3U88_03070 [Methylococcales bacterium]
MFILRCKKNREKGHFFQVIIKNFFILSICWLASPAWATFDNTPTRSTNIDLDRRGRTLINVNHETNSVSVFSVSNSNEQPLQKVAEIPVGIEPICVAIDTREAYVTNSASGTVSVISLFGAKANTVIKTIQVGNEPRGCALTPKGSLLYVANHTDSTVSVIDTNSKSVVDTVRLAGNPTAIAISSEARRDQDERVFVTQFFAQLIPNGPGEGFDNGKQGVVFTFPVNDPTTISRIALSPLEEVGFTADRSQFCASSNPDVHNEIFCPDPEAAPGDDVIVKDPQGAYPNQFKSAMIRRGKLYLPNVGAGPEPPVKFNVNVQALVHVVDTGSLTEQNNLHVNLNAQIKTEAAPTDPIGSLQRAFGNDLVAIDCNLAGTDCLVISRGGNYAMRVKVAADGSLDIGAPNNVIRFQTGNIPTGVVIDRKARRAYVNNQINVSVSVLDLTSNTVLAQDIPSGTPPEPGSFAHRSLMGKLVFFTALGTPDNGLAKMAIRDIDPVQFRGKASLDAWSGCGSCHDEGLADGVTWFFPTGPRQAIPLDAFYGPNSASDQRISNWNALRGSPTHEFTFNSRNIQGGTGFAGDPPNPNIFGNHGITQGGSDALDFETVWVETIRALNMPAGNAGRVASGRVTFDGNCASCHGGAKWTKSQVFHIDNPAIDSNGGIFIDPGVDFAGPQIISYTKLGKNLKFLEDVGTFDINNPIEIRGIGGAIGKTALGALGFNVPSLLGVGYHAPYFHNGAAQTLEDVFTLHALNDGTIESQISATERGNLLEFLNSIDARTDGFRSEGDDFRDPL